MTETEQVVTPANDVMPHRSGGKNIGFVFFILLVAVIVTGGFCFYPLILNMRSNALLDLGPTQQKINELEQRIRALDARIDDVNTRIDKLPSKKASDEDEEQGASAEEVAHMKNDMAKLSLLVTGLQAEVKQAGATAQHAAQSSMASAMAFIQLRSVAEAGRGFASELANLRSVAPDDTRFRETLDKLSSYAEKGAPPVAALRDEFIGLEFSVSVAIDKTAAQNWWQRIVAELKSLVSIRPLHGTDATDVLAVTENALSAGKLDTAVATVKTMPADAQDVLKNWVVKAQARAAIDAGLQDLSDRYVALVGSNSSQRTEP